MMKCDAQNVFLTTNPLQNQVASFGFNVYLLFLPPLKDSEAGGNASENKTIILNFKTCVL